MTNINFNEVLSVIKSKVENYFKEELSHYDWNNLLYIMAHAGMRFGYYFEWIPGRGVFSYQVRLDISSANSVKVTQVQIKASSKRKLRNVCYAVTRQNGESISEKLRILANIIHVNKTHENTRTIRRVLISNLKINLSEEEISRTLVIGNHIKSLRKKENESKSDNHDSPR